MEIRTVAKHYDLRPKYAIRATSFSTSSCDNKDSCGIFFSVLSHTRLLSILAKFEVLDVLCCGEQVAKV